MVGFSAPLLALLRRNVLRVGRPRLRVIAPASNTALFEEMPQWWHAVEC